jgi:hypothetical protein
MLHLRQSRRAWRRARRSSASRMISRIHEQVMVEQFGLGFGAFPDGIGERLSGFPSGYRVVEEAWFVAVSQDCIRRRSGISASRFAKWFAKWAMLTCSSAADRRSIPERASRNWLTASPRREPESSALAAAMRASLTGPAEWAVRVEDGERFVTSDHLTLHWRFCPRHCPRLRSAGLLGQHLERPLFFLQLFASRLQYTRNRT